MDDKIFSQKKLNASKREAIWLGNKISERVSQLISERDQLLALIRGYEIGLSMNMILILRIISNIMMKFFF